jgi:hypothetical protein
MTQRSNRSKKKKQFELPSLPKLPPLSPLSPQGKTLLISSAFILGPILILLIWASQSAYKL